MTWTVRPALHSDVPRLATLAARLFPDACPPGIPGEAITEHVGRAFTRGAVTSWFGPGRHCLLLLRDDEPLGYALLVDGLASDATCEQCVHRRPTMGVDKFYLDAGLRGLGASDALMRASIEHARDRGMASLWVATALENARARGFYRRLGFVECGRRTFMVGSIPNEDVVAERVL